MLDAIVFIGRFQPVHVGHMSIVREACKMAPHVIVLFGSANKPRSLKNPFNVDERREMFSKAILEEFVQEEMPVHFTFQGIDDYVNDIAAWSANVQSVIRGIVGNDAKIGLIGYNKDESSFYLQLFKSWDLILCNMTVSIDATQIREQLFKGGDMKAVRHFVSKGVYEYLKQFQESDVWNAIKNS